MQNENEGTEQSPAGTEAPKPIAFSPMTPHLQAFGAPDLQVSIGEDERMYHYHSLILASQSLYIDTLLSSPVAHKEKEKNAYIISRNSTRNMGEDDEVFRANSGAPFARRSFTYHTSI